MSVRFNLTNDLGMEGLIGNSTFENGEITDFDILRAQQAPPTFNVTFNQTQYRIT